LDRVPLAYTHNVVKYDRGSPVYYIERDNNPHNPIHGVRPVGILYGYEEKYENAEGRCERVYYMLCVSIDAILARYPEYRLISAPPQ
jgi:hypothetical protein